ncbi:MAG: hypothetical protein ACLRFE_01085 [Clostridia bacterium]
MTNMDGIGTKNKKSKKIKNKDRLIARMILGVGLSLTIANAVACGFIHSKFSDVKDEYWDANEVKDAYLDAYEQTDEFKTTYNADVTSLNNRLIAREIDGDTYDKELEKLKDNDYTEKVLLANANDQTKALFNEIYQKYLDLYDNFDKEYMPFAMTSMLSAWLPFSTLICSGLFNSKSNKKPFVEPEPRISKDLPPYHPINASENQICKDMLKNVTHNDDTQQNCGFSHLIHTEEETQENQNIL